MSRTPKFNVGKEKLSAQCEPCELPVTPFNVKVRICVFFDGTNNNKYNVNAGKMYASPDPESSYGADYSNIARLSNAFQFYTKKYDIQFALYVVGAGTGGDDQDVVAWGKGITNDGKESADNRAKDTGRTQDNLLGKATATGVSGIENRVSQAYHTIVNEIGRRIKVFRRKKKFAQTAPAVIKSVELDAFGFSRGAAKARHFVSKVLEGWIDVKEGIFGGITKHGFVHDLPRINHIQSVGQVKFVFLGLYDTVSSFGVNFTDDVKQLRLNLMNRVDRVVHLCAADEHRTNFALTDITSAGSKGVEIFLPGVHSDVGGGYLDYRGDAGTWVYYNPVPYRILKRRAGRRLIRSAGVTINHWFTCSGSAGHTWSEQNTYYGSPPWSKTSICPAGLLTNEIRSRRKVVANWPDQYEEWPDEWHEYDSWKDGNKQKYDNERLWLEKSGWLPGWTKLEEQDRSTTSLPLMFAQGYVSNRTFISNRYSWVTLQIMADFASDKRWSIKFNRAGIYGLYSLAKEPFLLARLRDLQSYIAQKCGPIPSSSGIGQSNWQDWFSHPQPCDNASRYPWLAELRRVYCHFSAHYQDGINFVLGVHAPQYNGESRQRRIFKG
jgi:hypothetical protein